MKPTKIIKISRVAMLLAVIISAALPSLPAYSDEPVRIGVLAFRPKPQTLAQWQPLADALKQAIPTHDFVVNVLSYNELEKAVAVRQLDFVLTNAGQYVLLNRRYGISAPLATLVEEINGQPVTDYGGVIFTRAGQANINTLSDLKGKSLAFTNTEALSGYQMQAYELSQVGIHLPQDAKLIATGMLHDNVVETVLDGRADAGFVRSGVLEELASEGKLDMAQIKIINRQNLPGSSALISTRLYPEWPFAALAHTNAHLVREVASALFNLENNSAVTQKIGIHGFHVPADYKVVEDMLRKLRLPPFEATPEFTLKDVWERYLWQVIGGLLAFFVILLLIFRVLWTNRKLKAQQCLMQMQQHKLQESEHKLSLILENVDANIFLKDTQGRYLYANHSVCELFKATLEEIVGQRDERFFDAETVAQLRINDRRVLEAGEILKTEETGLNFWNGHSSTYLSVKLPLRDETGEIYALCGISTDITERKQLEEVQKNALDRLQKIASRLPGVVYQYHLRTDGSSCFSYSSEGIADIFRLSPEDVREDASKIYDLMHPDDYDGVVATLQESARNLTLWRHEYRVKFDDGSIRWLLGDAMPQRENDGSTLWYGYTTDISERKQAEGRMRVSDLALKAISQGVIITHIDQSISWVNEAFVTITGYSKLEIMGKNCRFLQGPLTDPRTVAAIRLALEKVTEFSGEILNYRKDGTSFWNELMISPVHDEQGQLTHFIAVTRDITERKHNEMLIHENEQRLLDILNVSPIAIRIAINQGSQVVFYNQRYGDLIRNPQPTDDNPFRYYSRKEVYQEILAELERGNTVINRQIELRLPDHTERSVLASYMPIQYQNKAAVLGWFYDITELTEARKSLATQLEFQRQAEETLRIASAEERAIFDSATSGIVLIKDSVIQRCNFKLEEIFGYATGELNGQPTRLWYPDETAYVTGALPVYKQIAEGKFHRLEQQLIRKDGSLFWARLSGKALDSEDPTKGLVGIIDDITLEHDANEALLKAKELAEEATRTKSDFLANMSHEIRTPMNGVLGMLDLLRETSMTSNQQDWVETAHSSGETLLEIINDILDLTKLEAGKFEVEQVDFNLVDLVEDICALLARRAHAKGLELNCLLPMPLALRWRGDPMRLRQVLTNLVGNAVKFTEQGEVSVSIIPAAVADGRDALRFEVRDTGIGISEATLPRLFKSFSQADSATSRRFGGSGLGLFISKKLVELMGGSIGADSVPGQGSCFWFTLPLAPSANQEELTPSNDLSGKRTLIIDDNATNRNILNNYLTRWGLAVSEADNASAALIQLQASVLHGAAYDLILLDMQMPVMDGLTLAKCLRQIPALANLPIILLSSDIQIEPADYQGTGIVQRLLKPVRQMQLFDAMVNALQGGAPITGKPLLAQTQLPSYQGKKVLVVEDNKINQKVIVAKLGKFGLVPDVAENGQIALNLLATSSYDLIFMDCHMPVMDGYAATRELRLLETEKGLPHQAVIALTANALEGEREKCLAAGMDDYLTKPIVTEQLIALLARRLGSQPAAIAPALADINLAATEENQPVWDKTAALNHLEGDSALLDEMIALFLTEAPKQLGELTRFQAEGNLPALANTAHAIKGTVVHFYAEPATECARLLEQAARNEDSADFQGMTEALAVAVTDLVNSLQALTVADF